MSEWNTVLKHQQWQPKKPASKGQQAAAVPPIEMLWMSPPEAREEKDKCKILAYGLKQT